MYCFLYKKSIIKLGCEKMSFEDLIKVKPIKNKQELESQINQYIALENEILITLRDSLFNNHPEMEEVIKIKFNSLFKERELIINDEKNDLIKNRFYFLLFHISIDDKKPPNRATNISCIVSVTPVSKVCCRFIPTHVSIKYSNNSQTIAIKATIPIQNIIFNN